MRTVAIRSLFAGLLFAGFHSLAVADEPTGKQYALLVSVQAYDGGELSALNYPDADIEGLGDTLIAGGFPEANVIRLTGKRGAAKAELTPTVENIRRAMKTLLAKCSENDLIVIAFAGHGVQPKGGDLYFCPLKANPEDVNTLVSVNEVSNDLTKGKARFKLLLADICRNDPKRGGTRAVVKLPSVSAPQVAEQTSSMLAFYSCSEGEFAFENQELGHGVFFHYVIEGLKGDADGDRDNIVNTDELTVYVRSRVTRFVKEKLKATQRPFTRGESNDPVPLVVLQPEVLLHELFRNLDGNSLPKGWKGDGFKRVKDDTDAWVMLKQPAGTHWLTLPSVNVPENFYVEASVYVIGEQELHMQLLGKNGTVAELKLGGIGHVTVGGKEVWAIGTFKGNEINTIRFIHQDGAYHVRINGKAIDGIEFKSTAMVTDIRIGLTAGTTGEMFGKQGKIHAVKIGRIVEK